MTMTELRPRPNSIDTDAVESATDLLTEYLQCRRSILGHAWEFYADPEYPNQGSIRWKSAHCTRCHTKRHYQFAGRARIGHPVYVYPPKYKLSGDVTAEELWEEVFVREESGDLVIKKRIRGTKVSIPA